MARRIKPKKQQENTYAYFKSFGDVKLFLQENFGFFGLIALLIVLVYANSLNGEFVSDDIASYVNNLRIRNFSDAVWPFHWQVLTHYFFYSVFGANPIPLHVFSVFMHIFATITIFVFVSNLFSKKTAVISTILFSVHPLASEVVDWISGINYALMAAITFIILVTYIIYKNTSSQKYFYTTFGIFVLGVGMFWSPQIFVVVPVLIIFDQFLFNTKINLNTLKKLWIFLIPVGVWFATTTDHISGRTDSLTGLTSSANSYIQTLSYSIFRTIELMVYPKNLVLYHDAERITQNALTFMISIFVALAITTAVLWKKNRKFAGLILLAGASFYYMISPIQVAWFFAERYVYIALSIFTVFVALLFVKLEKITKIQNLAIILTVLLTIGYSVRTFNRNEDWKTRKSLWESTARIVPYSARTYNNLGDVYIKEGDVKRSVAAFARAIELNPIYWEAMHNLGLTYLKARNLDQAEKYLLMSLEFNPNSYSSYFNLGRVEQQRGNNQKAIQYFGKVLELKPNYAPARQIIQQLSN